MGKKTIPLGALEGTRRVVGTPRHECIIAPSIEGQVPLIGMDTPVVLILGDGNASLGGQREGSEP